MNVRTPVRKKRLGGPRRGAGALDRKYLKWVRTQRCTIGYCVSIAYPAEFSSRIEAHHAGDHGFGQKADDRTAIPLCVWHHTTGPESAHRLGKRFWGFHGLDRDELLKNLQARYKSEIGVAA